MKDKLKKCDDYDFCIPGIAYTIIVLTSLFVIASLYGGYWLVEKFWEAIK